MPDTRTRDTSPQSRQMPRPSRTHSLSLQNTTKRTQAVAPCTFRAVRESGCRSASQQSPRARCQEGRCPSGRTCGVSAVHGAFVRFPRYVHEFLPRGMHTGVFDWIRERYCFNFGNLWTHCHGPAPVEVNSLSSGTPFPRLPLETFALTT